MSGLRRLFIKLCFNCFLWHGLHNVVAYNFIHRTSIKSLSSLNSVTFDESEAVAEFERISISDRKVLAPKVTHQIIDGRCGNIRSLVSKSNIQPKETVVSVPYSYVLCQTSDEVDPQIAAFSSVVLEAPYRLAISLLLEEKKKSQSLLLPYIDLLPESYSTPLLWTDIQLETFPYQYIVRSVQAQRKKWSIVYEHMLQNVPDLKDVSIEQFVRAMTAVTSRAFEGERESITPSKRIILLAVSCVSLLAAAVTIVSKIGEITPLTYFELGSGLVSAILPTVLNKKTKICALLPFIDSSNHNSINPSCELNLSNTDDIYTISAKQVVQPNDEITISYGKRHNDDLLQYFGFVERGNPHDRYVLLDVRQKLRQLLFNSSSPSKQLSASQPQSSSNVKQQDATIIKRNKEYDGDKFNNILEEAEFKGMTTDSAAITFAKLLMAERRQVSLEFQEYCKKFPDHVSLCWIKEFEQAKLELLDQFQLPLF